LPTPMIGITTYRNNNQYGFPQYSLSEAYNAALARAGGLPIMIPLALPESSLEALLPRMDGLLLSGGGDIHPQIYNHTLHPLVSNVDNDRDRVELRLLDEAIQVGLPVLGICRGFQVINVGLGGSLYEDILDQRPESSEHQYYPDWPLDHLAHEVKIDQNSRLANILGGVEFEVNSLHHQGVENLAPGLKPTGFAPDGLLEAFEIPDHPFALGVQWHPEYLQAYAPMRSLFKTFVEACNYSG